MKKIPIPELLDKILRNWPDISSRTNPFILQMYRARDYFFDIYCKDIAPFGIQSGDFEVLASLRASGEPYELSPTNICRSIIISSGGLTKILNRLQKLKLIKRIRNKNDNRSSLVRLTTKGKDVIEKAMDIVLDTEKILFSNLTKKEQKQLYELLNKLITEPLVN